MFQFHIVRLKGNVAIFSNPDIDKFQFHIVRLKVRHRFRINHSYRVSIPYSSIKRVNIMDKVVDL